MIRPQSCINTCTRVHPYVVHVRTYLWTNIQARELSSTSFCSYIRSHGGDLDQVLQRLVEFPRVSFSCWRKHPTARQSVLLNYLTTSSSTSSRADPSVPSSYTWLRSRAITDIYITFCQLSTWRHRERKRYKNISCIKIRYLQMEERVFFFGRVSCCFTSTNNHYVFDIHVRRSDINSLGWSNCQWDVFKERRNMAEYCIRALQFQFLLLRTQSDKSSAHTRSNVSI